MKNYVKQLSTLFGLFLFVFFIALSTSCGEDKGYKTMSTEEYAKIPKNKDGSIILNSGKQRKNENSEICDIIDDLLESGDKIYEVWKDHSYYDTEYDDVLLERSGERKVDQLREEIRDLDREIEEMADEEGISGRGRSAERKLKKWIKDCGCEDEWDEWLYMLKDLEDTFF